MLPFESDYYFFSDFTSLRSFDFFISWKYAAVNKLYHKMLCSLLSLPIRARFSIAVVNGTP